MLKFTLKIIELRRETEDAVTIVFKQPGLKKIKYLPGQYLTLIFRINNRKYARPYSLSSAPGVDANLEVTVKRILGGIVSNHINDELAVGDMIEVMEPIGDFTFELDKVQINTNILLWGAGSGITPLMSIAKFILGNSTRHPVALIYGNHKESSTIFFKKINEMKQLYPQFSCWNFYSQFEGPEEEPYLLSGRIDPQRVLSEIEKAGRIKDSMHYICGPQGLKEAVKDALIKAGVHLDNIFYEDFEIIKNPEDFKDITTQFIELVQDNVVTKLEVVKGKSILEAGLDALIDLPYSCQTGHCNVCKAKHVAGEVRMIGVDREETQLLLNECLLCCSYPVSADVKIEILN